MTRLARSLRIGLIMALSFNASCVFRELHRNVEAINHLSVLSGTVNATLAANEITVVVLVRADSGAPVDSFVLGRRGKYFFAAPPGRYFVGAFIDTNRDLHFDPPAERGFWHGAPLPLDLAHGGKVENIDFDFDVPDGTPIDTALVAPELGRRGMHDLPDIHLGTVVSLDDPMFTDENGKFGMWQPVDFALKDYSGIYFTEPFDPTKIPVLFVHGITGNPANFKYLVEHLDHSRFQPWLVYYPSGMRLAEVGRGILRWIGATAVNNPFDRIIIVAHSMGGLVARSTINQWSENVGKAAGVKLLSFVSISTPWGGHVAAAQGVEHAPEVVPGWIDMAPGSDFLKALFETPLPKDTPFNLLFGFEGGSLIIGDVNDGTVQVSSELFLTAQDQAVKVYGYPESHTSILASKAVSDRLNAILSDAAK